MNLTENVLNLYRDSSFASWSEGMTWYGDAHDYALSLDTDVSRAAGIIAALSPLSPWANNKRKAAQFYAQNGIVKWNGTANGIGLSRNVRKAEAIWNGTDPLDVLVADKTRNFYLTIVEPNRDDHVPVIDRHAFDIAQGRITSDAERGTLGRKAVYAQYAQAYRDAAVSANIPVQFLQAITWCEWRVRLDHIGAWAG